MTAATFNPATYLAEQIADEKQLAALLGWTVKPSVSIKPGMWLEGVRGKQDGMGPPSSSSLPQWRRSWAGAGELIAPCQMMIVCTAVNVGVSCPDQKTVHAGFSEHPSRDAAIWFAMCKAAIAYLTAKSESKP